MLFIFDFVIIISFYILDKYSNYLSMCLILCLYSLLVNFKHALLIYAEENLFSIYYILTISLIYSLITY